MITLAFEDCSVALPSPIFGNDRIHTKRRIFEHTRRGTPGLKNLDYGTSISAFTYTIDGVTDTQISDFFNLFKRSLGQNLELTDYNDDDWLIIISESPRFEQPSSDSCKPYRLTFQFEGVEA